LKDDLRALVMREKGANLGLSIWVPKKNNAHKNFLTNLRLPADTDNKPDMLLHDLGKLGEDPEYEKRLEALFKPGSISHQ
jgi:hypothetical protein